MHRCPREFGYDTSLWTLGMAAEAAFEEGLTDRRVSGETIRATRFLQWGCEKLQAASKKVLLLIWDNASCGISPGS